MDADALDFAVVLDDERRLHGYLARRRSDGAGVVQDRIQRLEAWVRHDDTLKDAFGEMLRYEAGWVAVLDDDERHLGVPTPEALLEARRRSMVQDPTCSPTTTGWGYPGPARGRR